LASIIRMYHDARSSECHKIFFILRSVTGLLAVYLYCKKAYSTESIRVKL